MVEGGQGVMAAVVVTFPGLDLGSEPELREESMAGDWLQVEAPLGLEESVRMCFVGIWLVEG